MKKLDPKSAKKMGSTWLVDPLIHKLEPRTVQLTEKPLDLLVEQLEFRMVRLLVFSTEILKDVWKERMLV